MNKSSKTITEKIKVSPREIRHKINAYTPETEYHVDINSPAVQIKIMDGQKLYRIFLKKYQNTLDFNSPDSISKLYAVAGKMGIFEKAQQIRELIFGKDIHFYGVVYLRDGCVNDCSFCPGSMTNRQKAREEGKHYPTRTLTVEQAVAETKKVMQGGHKHITFLTGSTFPGLMAKRMLPYLIEIDKLGLNEMILNVEPPTQEGFNDIRKAITRTSLQFRVFQETYDKDTYGKLMNPHNRPLKEVPKADYQFRYDSQERALKAGFDNIGLGVLFGLSRYPLKEIEALRIHAEKLKKTHGKQPIRVCLPSANEIQNIGIKIPYFLERGEYSGGRTTLLRKGDYEKLNELLYALARLAMPTINIVSSERDGEAMLDILDKYATCSTLGVRPGVGDNTGIFDSPQKENDAKDVHFEQTTSFTRDPQKTVKNMKKRGYAPIINL